MTNDSKGAMGGSASAPVAIIGFGAAGVNAAIALRQAGYDGAVDVFSNLDTLPYSPILTSYYAGGMRPYGECFPWTEEEIDALALSVHDGMPATGLDVKAHVVKTSQGDFPYSKCIIATGASPSAAGFPPDCGYDPLVLHSMADAERMKAALEDAECRRVLVSGASMVALKMVEACLAQGKQVALVGMNPHVLDFNALPAGGRALREETGREGRALASGPDCCRGPGGRGRRASRGTRAEGDVQRRRGRGIRPGRGRARHEGQPFVPDARYRSKWTGGFWSTSSCARATRTCTRRATSRRRSS